MRKIFVLDTNILMSTEGRALTGFDDNEVLITSITLEELDHLKTALGEKGYQARECIRRIEELNHNKGKSESLKYGISINNGGCFRIVNKAEPAVEYSLPETWDNKRADNQILLIAKTMSMRHAGKTEVVLITNDISMKIKAETIGLPTQSYRNDQISDKEAYSGRDTLTLSSNLIDDLYKNKSLCLKEIAEQIDPKWQDFLENEYILIKSDSSNQSALTVFSDDTLSLVEDDKEEVFGIFPKNAGQKFAVHALTAPAEDIPLVILKGPAGTGKTILSIASALSQTYDDKKCAQYDKVLITRSNTLSDEDIGFLPGSLEDKMTPLLSPFFDNLKYLIGKNIEDGEQVSMQIRDMVDTNVIEITSLAYIRGRSLMNTYVIIDEVQNLSRLQIKTLVTRMGIGSKLVLLGDPDQIDNPKLDKTNNGLAYISEKFKDSPLCAQIEFSSSESIRSTLATEAIERLD